MRFRFENARIGTSERLVIYEYKILHCLGVDDGIARAQNSQISLRLRRTVEDGGEQLGIQTSQFGESLRVSPLGLVRIVVHRSELAGVGVQTIMPWPCQQMAYPTRVSADFHGKKPGNPAACGGGEWPASPAYGCVKPRLAFSLESPLDESGGQAREIKLKSFPSEAPGRFTATRQG